MKALTLHPPWAWAICRAGKDVENRTWAAPRSLIGKDLAVHSGKYFDVNGAAWIRETFGLDVPIAPPGGVVAVAMLRECPYNPGLGRSRSKWWDPAQIGWWLDIVRVLPNPVACRGAQGLWTLPTDVEARVLAQIGGVRG